jgi:hypothetical protein
VNDDDLQASMAEHGGLNDVPFQPRRGDMVETWIRSERDQYGSGSNHWLALDLLLDDYRLRADCGTPLDQPAPVECGRK